MNLSKNRDLTEICCSAIILYRDHPALSGLYRGQALIRITTIFEFRLLGKKRPPYRLVSGTIKTPPAEITHVSLAQHHQNHKYNSDVIMTAEEGQIIKYRQNQSSLS